MDYNKRRKKEKEWKKERKKERKKKCIGCLNIHGTHVTANNSTDDNATFFFASDLKIV